MRGLVKKRFRIKEEVIEGIKVIDYSDGTRRFEYQPLPHQRKLIESKDKVIYFRAGRGSGKSYAAAMIAVKALMMGLRCICLGQTGQAIREVLVPEIVKQLNVIIPGQYKYNHSSNKIVFGKGTIYFASYESLDSIRGYTSISISIMDEAALAPQDIFSVLSFCMRNAGLKQPRIYMMSTPRSDNWLTTFVRKEKIPIITAITSDNPNIRPEEIELMKATCVDENQWRREFYGEEVDDANGGVIFNADLLTNARKNLYTDSMGYCIGVDCAGLGTDSNIILVRNQNNILEIIDKKVATSAELCSIIRGLILKYGEGLLSHICIDEAFGLGLAERLAENNVSCSTIAFGGSPSNKAYANNRAEMYFNLKKGIETNGLNGLNEELIRELKATKYILNNSNRLQIIPKEDIKVNLGRSPDYADALALTYYQPIIPIEVFESRVKRQSKWMSD